jgi:hypothetical protein
VKWLRVSSTAQEGQDRWFFTADVPKLDTGVLAPDVVSGRTSASAADGAAADGAAADSSAPDGVVRCAAAGRCGNWIGRSARSFSNGRPIPSQPKPGFSKRVSYSADSNQDRQRSARDLPS